MNLSERKTNIPTDQRSNGPTDGQSLIELRAHRVPQLERWTKLTGAEKLTNNFLFHFGKPFASFLKARNSVLTVFSCARISVILATPALSLVISAWHCPLVAAMALATAASPRTTAAVNSELSLSNSCSNSSFCDIWNCSDTWSDLKRRDKTESYV